MDIVISPSRPLIDTELVIRLTGLDAGEHVTVRAWQDDLSGRRWTSWAAFDADPDGVVDLTRDAPKDGTYSELDPMGLIWSMTTADQPHPPSDPLAATCLTVTAEASSGSASAVAERRRVGDDLVREPVSDNGIVGVLWRPADPSPQPAVILLGGSEGGLHEDDAALMAAHGFAVLSLGYYGLPGLPPVLENVPLEYFQAALEFLAALPYVTRIGIAGGSKGGEAALLAAATFPEIRAAASIVGSGIITQGIGQSVFTGTFLEILSDPTPNWTYRGEVLPFLPNVVTPELEQAVAAREPVSLKMAFHPGLELTGQVTAATIPVERINGPVLLISADDDQGYGREFHDVAADRLRAHRHAYDHVIFEDAGHLIAAPPYGPTTVLQGMGPGVLFRHGGTPSGTARARAGAWAAQLEFFRSALVAD